MASTGFVCFLQQLSKLRQPVVLGSNWPFLEKKWQRRYENPSGPMPPWCSPVKHTALSMNLLWKRSFTKKALEKASPKRKGKEEKGKKKGRNAGSNPAGGTYDGKGI